LFKAKLYLGFLTLILVALLVGACAAPKPAPPAPTPTPPAPAPTPVPTTTGTIEVYVTDAPPREEVTSINVTVAEVKVHKALAEQEQEQQQSEGEQTQEQEQEQQQTQEGEDRWISIDISDDARTFDLLQIRGNEQHLGTSEVEATKYTQIRLVIDTVQVKLGNGDPQDAIVPSKELKFVHPFKVIGGETTALVVDFDADKMVTVTGADKIIVKPVVKLEVRKGKPAGEKPDKETTEQASVEVSCDEFVEEQHISKNLEVDVGDSFTVTLCSNPTTGFQWSETAEISDPAVLEQVNHEFVPPEDENIVGGAGKEVWTFKALKEGNSTISMEYSQPWEGGDKEEWTFTLTVVVE